MQRAHLETRQFCGRLRVVLLASLVLELSPNAWGFCVTNHGGIIYGVK